MPGVDYGRAGLTASSKEIVKGVFPPTTYGIETWQALETRVVMNLTHQLMDLSKALVAQGKMEQARAAAREAIDLDLAHVLPAAVAPPGPPAASSAENTDRRPLARRIRSALAKGWFMATGMGYFSLHPLPGKGDGLGGRKIPPVSAAVWQLLKARHLQKSDPAGSARAARTAHQQLTRIISDRMSAARTRPADKSIVAEDNLLGSDPFVRGFPWGWISVDFVLTRLSAYLQEAARLTGDLAVARQARVQQDRVALFLEGRKKPGRWELPYWTSEGRLGKPPT